MWPPRPRPDGGGPAPPRWLDAATGCRPGAPRRPRRRRTRRADRSAPPTWRPLSRAFPPARRTRWPFPWGRAPSASWSPTRLGDPPPPPPGPPAVRPRHRAHGAPWGARTAGGGAWDGRIASGYPPRRPAQRRTMGGTSSVLGRREQDHGPILPTSGPR